VTTSLTGRSAPPCGAATPTLTSPPQPCSVEVRGGGYPSSPAPSGGGIVRIFELRTEAGRPCVGYVVADDVLDPKLARGLHIVLEALRGGPR
jgi:hypothetical protein